MSIRSSDGSQYDNHRREAELQDGAAHAHRVAEQQGKQDHLTGHEQSRQALEGSHNGHQPAHAAAASHAIATFGHEDIAALAFQLWKDRGCPDGSPEEDWFHAAQQLRSSAHSR